MTAAEYQARRRRNARAAGLCGQCAVRDAKPGRFRCAHCAPIANANVQRAIVRRAGTGWCAECLAANFHRAECGRGVDVEQVQA